MSALATLRRWPARAAILLIKVYQTYLSPLWPPTCRFTPTCSQYAVEALSEYGVIRGSWLAAVRLAKCGPWHRGGWDPIPVRHNTVDRHDAGEDFWGTPGKQGGSRSRV